MAVSYNEIIDYLINNLRSPCEECEDKKCDLVDGNECEEALKHQKIMRQLYHKKEDCFPPEATLIRHIEEVPYSAKNNKTLFYYHNCFFTCSRCGRQILFNPEKEIELENEFPITHCLCGAKFVGREDLYK